jgi:hypothetical protein
MVAMARHISGGQPLATAHPGSAFGRRSRVVARSTLFLWQQAGPDPVDGTQESRWSLTGIDRNGLR